MATVTPPSVDLRVVSDGGLTGDGGVRVVTDLRRHIPRIALEWDDDAPGRAWQRVDATMVFADISGFTALTEKLARRGRIGAEELIETLNRIFGGMLGEAALRGGELLKFGGDALLFAFRGDGHPERACAAAVDMRIALREAAKIPTSVGRLKLSMSVGVHSGPVDFFLVGAPTRELLILGSAATQTAEAEHAAVAGEILVSAATARRLPSAATRARSEDDRHLLRWRVAPMPPGDAAAMPVVTQERLRTLFPVALGEYLADGVPDPEHKVATIGFARFSGTDTMLTESGHDAVAEALHGTISVFEEALIAEGGTLLATDLDSDGGKLFMASGVPYSSEDDEGRMLRAMRHVLDVGTPLPLQIGVNRGHVFAAEVGALYRAAYSAMGDTTNTAARIMSKAPHGVLFAHPTVLEQSRTLFATEPAGPFPMKGKAVPVLVHAVGDELGTRQAQTRSSLPLVGRDEEVATIRAALDEAVSGKGGVITVGAATGLGKSRVIAESMKGLEATVVTVRAEPYGVTSPYRMLRDPVRDAFGIERGEPAEMSRTLLSRFEHLMPDLLPLAPLLEDVVNVPIPPTPQASAIEPRFRPDRIADMILRLIGATVRGPFVLRVEEGHWADAASIAVLRRIADATTGRPWAVVVARRPDGEGFRPERGAEVVLGPLPNDVMRRIVIAATESAPLREHEIDGIVARAQGNPLFAEELVRVFREVGSLEAMPESLHAALDTQIDALDPHSRRVLRYASVLGRSFRREVINETLAGDDIQIDEATLDKLRDFLEPDGPARLRFRNSMIRDAAYEGLAYRLRAKLHRAAGGAVERLSTDLEADADTLSLHFWRAGDDAQTWTYARIAADRAARAYANADAAAQYQRALEASRHLDDVSDSERHLLWRRVGDVLDQAGLFDQAIDAYQQARRLAPDVYDRAEVMALRARVRSRRGAFRAALAELTRAQSLVKDDPSDEARRQRVRIGAVRVAVGREAERPRAVLAEVLPLIDEARAVQEEEALETALVISDAVRMQLGDASVGEATREAVALALKNGRRWRAGMAQSNLGVFCFYGGRWAEATEHYEGARRNFEEIGAVASAATAGLNLGEVYVNLGRLDLAEEVLADSIRVLRTSGMDVDAAYGLVQQARLLVARGRYVEAEELAMRAEEEFHGIGQPMSAYEALLVRCEAMTRYGKPEASLELVDSVGAEAAGFAPLPVRQHLERARALLALGDVAAASDEIAAGIVLAEASELSYEKSQLLGLDVEIAALVRDDARADRSSRELRAIESELGISPSI